jgi:hypothetical protein
MYNLRREVQGLKQNQKHMLQYIGDFKRNWEELNQFRAPTTDPAIIQEREQELLFQFLTGLDESYEHMRA